MKFNLKKAAFTGIALTLAASAFAGSVYAVDTDSDDNSTNISDDNKQLKETTVYIVGDSTACIYNEDETYAVPRAGWGMYLADYLSEKADVVDLALSGRSSKSFILEPEYETLKSSIKSGDYLIIQFGHNDEKDTDPERYTDPLGDVNTEGSFRYVLYNYYIKLALDNGATPILVSPVSRRKFDENDKIKDTHLDYDDTVRALAEETDTVLIDMTSITEEYYNELGVDGSMIMHALYNDRTKSNGIDNTHFNHYGAGVIAKIVAEEISEGNTDLKKYVSDAKFNSTENNYITKGEFIATITRALSLEADASETFSDVPDDYENAKYIAIAKKLGVAAGDGHSMLGFSNYITRQEMAAIALRAISSVKEIDALSDSAISGCTDFGSVHNYAKSALSYMIENGYMNLQDGKINPLEIVSKEDAAKMVVSLYYLQAEDTINGTEVQEQSLEELEKVENTK